MEFPSGKRSIRLDKFSDYTSEEEDGGNGEHSFSSGPGASYERPGLLNVMAQIRHMFASKSFIWKRVGSMQMSLPINEGGGDSEG